MNNEHIQTVIKRVWPERSDVGTEALREQVVITAFGICHETGELESYLDFVTEVVKEFMNHN